MAQPNYSASTDLTTITCCHCGITFAMPTEFDNRCLNDENIQFYCPRGHKQHYVGQTEEQKLQQQLQRTKLRLRWAEENRDHTERSRRAVAGHLTRARKKIGRVENGVCPHCNRTFQNLQAHMKTKH